MSEFINKWGIWTKRTSEYTDHPISYYSMAAKAFCSASLTKFYGTIWCKNPLFSQIQLISTSYFFSLDSSWVWAKLTLSNKLHLCNIEQSLLTGLFRKVCLLEVGLGCLSALARCATWVSVVNSRWLQHVKSEAFVFWVRGDDFWWAEWSDCVVKSVCVQVEGQPVRKGSAWDGYVEIFEELIGFVSGVIHDVSAVGDFSAYDHTDASIDVEDSSVGFFD